VALPEEHLLNGRVARDALRVHRYHDVDQKSAGDNLKKLI
jgi:hypothetical protein